MAEEWQHFLQPTICAGLRSLLDMPHSMFKQNKKEKIWTNNIKFGTFKKKEPKDIEAPEADQSWYTKLERNIF